jgi:hypothetical protein
VIIAFNRKFVRKKLMLITYEPVGGDVSLSFHVNDSSFLSDVAALSVELVFALR